ncbi:MAG: hypothetical protein K9L87_03355 [Candidatus Omnitrophica bacterium]|nr:hypothetical protein [Candidatus Omnitrophota bacterium]MCF7877787.1 hypothetical protein [Candidatus Omnitrophota bacterium]MCF7892114.1 hypothetical protein [Candidatus Omnitrophota bacterium]MCF7896167.1 hypothetical protein [Candidatus Omnitrophota bacterium]MCF7897768.1 hypothetical protein [Candidatus Omnitrophota bacterium]
MTLNRDAFNKLAFYLIFAAFTGCASQSVVLVAEEGKYKDYTYTVPFEVPAEGKKEVLVDLGVIYEGMPAGDLQLYGFGEKDLIKSYKSNGRRYLVFPKKNKPAKVIIFVLQENRIIDWFQEDLGIVK